MTYHQTTVEFQERPIDVLAWPVHPKWKQSDQNILFLQAHIGDILRSQKGYLEVIYHHLEILALGSHTHGELRNHTIAGRSRDDIMDFWFDGHTCQRMTVEEDNLQRLTYTEDLGSMLCGVLCF